MGFHIIKAIDETDVYEVVPPLFFYKERIRDFLGDREETLVVVYPSIRDKNLAWVIKTKEDGRELVLPASLKEVVEEEVFTSFRQVVERCGNAKGVEEEFKEYVAFICFVSQTVVLGYSPSEDEAEGIVKKVAEVIKEGSTVRVEVVDGGKRLKVYVDGEEVANGEAFVWKWDWFKGWEVEEVEEEEDRKHYAGLEDLARV